MSNSKFADPRDITSESEFRALCIIQRVSASLSICGSAYIIWEILGNDPNRKKRSSVYHRIMLVLSLFDIASSIALFFGNWAMPRDTEYSFIYESYGNMFSCRVQGFLILLGWCGVVACNTFLSLNFLMAVKYNYSNIELKQKIERPLHAVLLLFCLPLSLLPFVWNLFNEGVCFCFIGTYPRECSKYQNIELECVRGDPSAYRVISLLVLGLPGPIAFVGISVSMILVYRTVKYQEREAKRFARDSTMHRLSVHSRKIFWRGFWYLISFSVVWITAFLVHLLGNSIAIQIIAKFLLPLQGFGNAFVYTNFNAPSYIGSNISNVSKFVSRQLSDSISTMWTRRFNSRRERKQFGIGEDDSSILSDETNGGHEGMNVALKLLSNIQKEHLVDCGTCSPKSTSANVTISMCMPELKMDDTKGDDMLNDVPDLLNIPLPWDESFIVANS